MRASQTLLALVVGGALLTGGDAFAARGRVSAGTVVDFEKDVPVVPKQALGFRAEDLGIIMTVPGGAGGTKRGAEVTLGPGHDSVFLQGKVRRLYLASGKAEYRPGLFNVLVLWLRIPEGSPLIARDGSDTFGVWTYHWQPGDVKVGGLSNQTLATDSQMHGYANFSLAASCSGRWMKVVLSVSAFKQQRSYWNWFAAQGVTGEYDFFSTLRQLQFVALGPPTEVAHFKLDEIGFATLPATAQVEPGFEKRVVDAAAGDVRVPVVLRNPSGRSRSYRYFLSSEIGASRESMHQAHWRTNNLMGMRAVQQGVGGGGGMGAAVLMDEKGRELGWSAIEIPAGGEWRGAVLHRVKAEMLGSWTSVSLPPTELLARRNVLTTSLIFWDPDEPPTADMGCIQSAPSKADDGAHDPPPGFPPQFRPPEGWRSERSLGAGGGIFRLRARTEVTTARTVRASRGLDRE